MCLTRSRLLTSTTPNSPLTTFRGLRGALNLPGVRRLTTGTRGPPRDGTDGLPFLTPILLPTPPPPNTHLTASTPRRLRQHQLAPHRAFQVQKTPQDRSASNPAISWLYWDFWRSAVAWQWDFTTVSLRIAWAMDSRRRGGWLRSAR